MNPIDKDTILFGFIDEMATKSSKVNRVNSLFKSRSLNACLVPMNIREDDLYFTISNLRTSQLSAVLIGKNYQDKVLDLLDIKNYEVENCGFVEVIKIQNGKLLGFVSIGSTIVNMLEKSQSKFLIFGATSIAEAIIINAIEKNILNKITLAVRYIEDAEDLLKKYPNLDVKFYDENHILDTKEYEIGFITNSKDLIFVNSRENIYDLDNLPQELQENFLKAEVDILVN